MTRFKRPSPGTVIAVIALIAAMAGVAVAANKIGPKQIKPNAVRTSKIKDGAVTTSKLADGAVTSPKISNGAVGTNQILDNGVGTGDIADGAVGSSDIADGAVGTAKLADGAVSTAKLDASERSEGFTATRDTNTPLPTGNDTTVIQATLPVPGNYIFSATASVGTTNGAAHLVDCTLLDANNPLSSASVQTTATNAFSSALTLTGASDGGVVKLSCNPDGPSAANHMSLSAVRVANVTTLTAGP
jgi:hypothetical protein